MKKLIYLFALTATLMLSSCLSEAQVTYREYYDSETLTTVVYINELPYYRIWDEYRWLYRPVPRERHPFIHVRPHERPHMNWGYHEPPRRIDHGNMNRGGKPNMQPSPKQGDMGGFMDKMTNRPQTINRGGGNMPNVRNGGNPQVNNRGGGNMQSRASQPMRGSRR